ncbi:MAG: hypothetical protein K8I82_21980, partial [Anaerolineae bacterium]|nr:hypothetical protein [Anaerolineae bacterium]
MFRTTREIDVRSGPSYAAELVGKVGENIEVRVAGTPIEAEGWIWHNVEGPGNLWVPECRVGGTDSNLVWQGTTPKPVPAGKKAAVSYPKIEGDFTNKVLLEAFQKTATGLGQPN